MRGFAALLVLGAIAAGCGTDSAADADTDIDTDTIVDATVTVRADGCGPRTQMGTGTSVGEGLVVTAAHVVAGADRVDLVDDRDETTTADVVLFDPALDVAALRPVTAPGRSVPLRAERASTGETGVTAIPSDDGSIELVEIEVVQRVSILTTDIYRDEQVERPGLRVAVTVEPGDSGAMVHLPGGGVGIIWSRSTERPDQAWTVDLPEELSRPELRVGLVDPVDTGPCP